MKIKKLRSAALALMLVAAEGSLLAGKVGDISGNRILKNVNDAAPSTLGPTTSSSTYAVIAEMTQTITTKGNKVIVIFSITILSGFDNTQINFQIFKDGSALSDEYEFVYNVSGTNIATFGFSFLDSPTAASHTYDVRWHGTGQTITALRLARRLQVVELG